MKLRNKVLRYGLSLLTAGAALYGVTANIHAAGKSFNLSTLKAQLQQKMEEAKSHSIGE